MEITQGQFADLLLRRYVGMSGQHVDSKFHTGEVNYTDIQFCVLGNVIATIRKLEKTKYYPEFLKYFEGVGV